jgi:hypothetical protein
MINETRGETLFFLNYARYVSPANQEMIAEGKYFKSGTGSNQKYEQS